MKQIPLGNGIYSLVDDEDYDFIMQRKWYFRNGYAARGEYVEEKRNNRTVFMHREVMKSITSIDHIDGDKLNNQKSNLRVANKSQNAANMVKKQKCTSRFKGVVWHKKAKKWMSRIVVNYKGIYLGIYNSEIEAAEAYNDAALKHFGEFARLNEI